MKAYSNTNVIHLPIKPRLRAYNVIPHEWRNIYKNGGKLLSEKEKGVLWTIIRLSNHYQTYQVKIDYAFLIKQSGFYCSQPQMRRYLKSLQETKIIDFVVQASEFNYKKILIIDINTNELKAYLPCILDDQICKANSQGHYKDKSKVKSKEIKEISKENISFISKKEKNKNKKEKDETSLPSATGSVDEPAAVNEFLGSPPDQQPQQAEIIVLPQIIHQMTAAEEQEHYRNHSLRPDDPGLHSHINDVLSQLITSELEKEVTGEQDKGGDLQPRVETSPSSSPPGGRITTRIEQEMKHENRSQVVTNCHRLETLWEKVSKDMKNYYGEALYNAWFKDIGVNIDSDQKVLTLKARSEFFKNYIETNYLHTLSDFVAHHDSDYKIKIEVKE